MKCFRFVVMLLMVIGALNWGLVGFFEYNAIIDLFWKCPKVARLIFALVGLAGLYGITFLCKACYHRGDSCGSHSCGCCKKDHYQQ